MRYAIFLYMTTTYPSDLSDTEWEHLQQYSPTNPASARTVHPLSAIVVDSVHADIWTPSNADEEKLGRMYE
jgi:hypothetical protein